MKTVELLVEKFVLVSFGLRRSYVAAKVVSVKPKSNDGGKMVVEVIEGKNKGRNVSRSYSSVGISHADVFMTAEDVLAESARRRG